MSKMPKSEREASLLEAKLLSALHHPNIVQVYDICAPKNRNTFDELYIVLEIS